MTLRQKWLTPLGSWEQWAATAQSCCSGFQLNALIIGLCPALGDSTQFNAASTSRSLIFAGIFAKLQILTNGLKRHCIMSKYYELITGRTQIKTKSGQNAIVSAKFRKSSALIISRCSFLQAQIQKVIFSTHGPQFAEASKYLKDNKHPRARMEFLCSTPYGLDDAILSEVFSHSQTIFREIYELRCVLAHEVWMSCDDYSFKVLFSQIDEEARLSKVGGRLKHDETSTSREVFDAIVRYISKIKLVGCEDLESAIRDISLCEWMLMVINQILEEEDPQKRDDLRMAFHTFGGTSHLFTQSRSAMPEVEVHSSKKHSINR